MRHGSLFSGIGGFDLAASWMGWENVFQVEWDRWCQRVLAKNFPGTLRFGDIKEFNEMLKDGRITTNTKGAGFIREKELENDKENNGTGRGCNSSNLHKISGKNGRIYIGRLDIITGGFPCQPFSHAGKRKGTDDSRYLWPEMLTTIRILKPSFVVGENVAGLVSMENGKTLDRILSDLANEGYATEQFIIPACAIGAWHRRDRIWIIAYNECKSDKCITDSRIHIAISREQGKKAGVVNGGGNLTNVSNTQSKGLEGCDNSWGEKNRRTSLWGNITRHNQENRRYWDSEPSVGRVANGIPNKLDRINGINYEIIREELFALWQKDDPTRMGKWEERFNIQEQKILQFSMLWLLDRVNIQNKENEWKENCTTKIQIDNMRTMWIEGILAEASQRWQYEKQQSGEYNDTLSGLSQGRTSQKQYMGNIWDEEPNTPRVASGIRNRVDRLKGLGNAIVPQVAYEIFKAIQNSDTKAI